MKTITIIFTKSPWSIISWLIRWAVPRSRFAFSLSSHCIIVDPLDSEYIYEADFSEGVRRIKKSKALIGCIIVKEINYNVSNSTDGVKFADTQIGKKYDIKGALGLGLSPYRKWSDDNQWFCYELAGAILRASGRDEFENISHIGEISLLTLKP